MSTISGTMFRLRAPRRRRLMFPLILLGAWVGLLGYAPPASAEIEGPPDDPKRSVPAPVKKDLAPARLAPRVAHTPVASAPAGQTLAIIVAAEAAREIAELDLYYRVPGERHYRTAIFALARDQTWQATIPANEVTVGVLEYYIASRDGDRPDSPARLHFASAELPHPVIIVDDEAARWQRSMLAQHLGNHSQFQLSGDYVDRGARTVTAADGSNPTTIRDSYYRLEVDYTYRMLSLMYSIRIGGGVLRGDSYVPQLLTDGTSGQVRPDTALGLTYGFAEMRLRLGHLARLDVRATLGAGPVHFDGGLGGQLIIGRDPGTHFALGIDGVTSIGVRAWARLAWNTVPHVPMSFTIEATNLPLGRDVGGRLYLGAGYRFGRHASFNAHIGYAFRDYRVGGPDAGLAMQFEF